MPSCSTILKTIYMPDQAKRFVKYATGVIPLVYNMCINTCITYTGPFSNMETCPYCSTPHYDPAVLEQSASKTKITQREFHTMPLGPQLQAIYCSWESAEQMHYGENKMDEIMKEFQAGSSGIVNYEDWCHGSDFLKAFHEKHLKKGDPILMFSIDGAQLYCNKTSDCWMYICVIFNLDPATGRYKKTAVLFGAIIPGPNKPKILESFLFPALHHLSVIQKEGLLIWDTFTDSLYISHPFLALGTAHGSAMAYLMGSLDTKEELDIAYTVHLKAIEKVLITILFA